MVYLVLYRTAQISSNKPNASTVFDFTGSVVSDIAFSFSSRGMSTGDNIGYYADNGEGEWERGLGTWNASTLSLTRTTLRESSTGAFIDWSSGTNNPTVWSDGRQEEDGLKTTPINLTYSVSVTPVSLRNGVYRCIMTGDMTLNDPSSPQDGDRVVFWLTASGSDRDIDLDSSIIIPTSSALTFPVTITSGKKARLVIEYDSTLNGGQWEVISFVNGY